MFRDRLRAAREKANLSQTEFAKKLRIPATTYRNYENSDREPSFSVLVSISRTLGVSADYLLGLTDFESPAHENLTRHDVLLIEAYNTKTEMQPAIDRLLMLDSAPMAINDMKNIDMETASEFDARIEDDVRDLAKSKNKS